MDSGIITALMTDELRERGAEPTADRLAAAHSNLEGRCADDPEKPLFDAAREAAAQVAEVAQKN